MDRTKIVLVEDSGLMRIRLTDILLSEKEIELVGIAKNGKEGAELVNELQPDVVITDFMMPDYDGLYLIKEIQKKAVVPVIVLSALDRKDPAIFEALKAGAYDFVDKSDFINKVVKKGAMELITKIKEAKNSNTNSLDKIHEKNKNTHLHSFDGDLQFEIIVIGASTGGPSTLEYIIKQLPSNLPVPVVVAQHMPERFIETFTNRLKEISPIEIKVAKTGEQIKGNTIYMMPGNKNLKLAPDGLSQGNVFRSDGKVYDHFNNPSVDALFLSAANIYKNKCMSVLLTGMGKDGVNGVEEIFKLGGRNIAQDEKSCVVFGMPRFAIESKKVHNVVGLKDLPGFIISCF